MTDARQSAQPGARARGRTPVRRRLGALVGLALLSSGLTGCGDDGVIDPEALRFGQIGSVEVRVEAPLRLSEGQLYQTLRWSSSGAWSLLEGVSYRGLAGDETLRRSEGDPSPLAGAYASLITQLNEDDRLKLFIDSLPSDLKPPCGPVTSRITFTIRDDARKRDASWVRCAEGSLGTLTPVGAGPGSAASRLVMAALLIREATVGEGWDSAYLGTIPFGTLDRGEDSKTPITSPVTYIDAAGFQLFWEGHAPTRPVPAVDFNREMVVVAVVGERKEAGDSVEVRRILQVDRGTVIEVVERRPGDFCSPAARTHVPFHVVVAPRTPIPHRFADILVERPSCGR